MINVLIAVLAFLFVGIAACALWTVKIETEQKPAPSRPRVKPAEAVDPWDVDKLRRGQQEL